MKAIRTIPALREALHEARMNGHTLGLVPTMGAFHEGHLSLMRRARAQCDVVVVSLFVNPMQFNDRSDLDAYPRDEQHDATLAEQTHVDLLFAPDHAELYPDGFATRVTVADLGEALEGAHRGPGHFAGVATIVVKLLNIVGPNVAYFGQKDAQQTVVIRRLVRDLDIPVRIEVAPTVRAPDGLALSSRNRRLSSASRTRAASLYRSLQVAEQAISSGERDPGAVAEIARRELAVNGIEPEYFELVDPNDFTPVTRLDRSVLAVVAASLDGTRLIDNHLIAVPSARTTGGLVVQHTTNTPADNDTASLLAEPSA